MARAGTSGLIRPPLFGGRAKARVETAAAGNEDSANRDDAEGGGIEAEDDPSFRRAQRKRRMQADARAQLRLRAARKKMGRQNPRSSSTRLTANFRAASSNVANPYAKQRATRKVASPYAKASPASFCYEALLFTSRHDPELAGAVGRVVKNDPEVKKLKLSGLGDLHIKAWRHLGDVLQKSRHVEELSIHHCCVDVMGLCAPLQNNRHLRKISLRGIDLGSNDVMGLLALCLGRILSITEIELAGCDVGLEGVGILSRALSRRLEDSLVSLTLDGNSFGDIELDELVGALRRNANLKRLGLHGNGIGMKGCLSIASLLEGKGCALEELDLSGNRIDNAAAIVLADSLAGNGGLRTLGMGGNYVTAAGWAAFSKYPSVRVHR